MGVFDFLYKKKDIARYERIEENIKQSSLLVDEYLKDFRKHFSYSLVSEIFEDFEAERDLIIFIYNKFFVHNNKKLADFFDSPTEHSPEDVCPYCYGSNTDILPRKTDDSPMICKCLDCGKEYDPENEDLTYRYLFDFPSINYDDFVFSDEEKDCNYCDANSLEINKKIIDYITYDPFQHFEYEYKTYFSYIFFSKFDFIKYRLEELKKRTSGYSKELKVKYEDLKVEWSKKFFETIFLICKECFLQKFDSKVRARIRDSFIFANRDLLWSEGFYAPKRIDARRSGEEYNDYLYHTDLWFIHLNYILIHNPTLVLDETFKCNEYSNIGWYRLYNYDKNRYYTVEEILQNSELMNEFKHPSVLDSSSPEYKKADKFISNWNKKAWKKLNDEAIKKSKEEEEIRKEKYDKAITEIWSEAKLKVPAGGINAYLITYEKGSEFICVLAENEFSAQIKALKKLEERNWRKKYGFDDIESTDIINYMFK